ncbi:MAG: response regulator [bacterium]
MLLVEDEEPVRKMTARMLSNLGFAVLQAKDGIEAVEIFGQHQDEIACLLSDLTMPRMDGWETITALRAIRHDLPVILASGYDEASAMAGEHPELPDFFLNKPYDIHQLGEMIGRAITRKKPA